MNRTSVSRALRLIFMAVVLAAALSQRPAAAGGCPTIHCSTIINYCSGYCGGWFQFYPQGTCTASDGSTKNWAGVACGCGSFACWY